VSGDQQHGYGHTGGKERHRNSRSAPVVAVHHGYGEEDADRLHEQARLNLGPLEVRQDVARRHDTAADHRGLDLCAHHYHLLIEPQSAQRAWRVLSAEF